LILVDTSIWVDHLRAVDDGLKFALDAGNVFIHPFVIGEVACGVLPNRAEVLREMHGLATAPVVTHSELLAFIEERSLMGRGIGCVDIHLLASCALAVDAVLWTRDRRLADVAAELLLAL